MVLSFPTMCFTERLRALHLHVEDPLLQALPLLRRALHLMHVFGSVLRKLAERLLGLAQVWRSSLQLTVTCATEQFRQLIMLAPYLLFGPGDTGCGAHAAIPVEKSLADWQNRGHYVRTPQNYKHVHFPEISRLLRCFCFEPSNSRPFKGMCQVSIESVALAISMSIPYPKPSPQNPHSTTV